MMKPRSTSSGSPPGRLADETPCADALRAREHAVIEAIPHPVWEGGLDGRMTYANHRWIDYTGRATVDGDAWSELVAPADAARIGELWAQARATCAPVEADVRLRRVGGEHRWHRISLVPFRDSKGDAQRVIATFTDVHEVREAGRSRREMDERFLQIAETTDHVLWVVDLLPARRTVYVSPGFSNIWGREPSEARANPRLWLESVHPADHLRVTAAFDAWLADPDSEDHTMD